MTSTQHLLAAAPAALNQPRRPLFRAHLHGSNWAIAFVVPYAGGDHHLRDHLRLLDGEWHSISSCFFEDESGTRWPHFTMLLSLLLSQIFIRRRWWIKAL